MAVEHGVDLLGGGVIGDGEHVIADLRNADDAIFRRDGIDGMAQVCFARGGMGVKPIVEAGAGDLADQDHGVGDGAVGTVGVRHAVQGDGDLVEVALPIDAGGVDELLVIGDAARGLEVFVEEDADGLEVDEEDAVGLGEETGGFRRSFGAEEDGRGQQQENCG